MVNKTGLVNGGEGRRNPKDAAKILDSVLDSTKLRYAGEKVQIIGFGTFEVRERKARNVISPPQADQTQLPRSSIQTAIIAGS